MPHTLSADAIVLATYNVGEADRFCVLFTKEYGRLAARATAARKPGSKLGGALLPLQRVQVEMREWNGGYVVTGARKHAPSCGIGSLAQFLAGTEIVELLLLLLQDGESHEELFTCAAEALVQGTEHASPTIVRILHLLGHFPEMTAECVRGLSDQDKMTIDQWIRGLRDAGNPSLSPRGRLWITRLCETVVEGHGSGRRRSPEIAGTMLAHT